MTRMIIGFVIIIGICVLISFGIKNILKIMPTDFYDDEENQD